MITTTKKTKKIIVWILIFTITGLLFSSFLPWITTSENSTENKLYYNQIMMEKSNNGQIRDFASDLSFISHLFGLTIVFSLITLLGLVINLTIKYPTIGKILMYVGCLSLILSILIIRSQIVFIENVNATNTIQLAEMLPFFNYAYIPFIFEILMLVFSGIYTGLIGIFVAKRFIHSKKDKKVPLEKKPVDNKERTERKPIPKELPLNFNDELKTLELNDLNKSKAIEEIDEPTEHSINEPEVQKINPNIDLSPNTKEEIKPEPFPSEKPKEKIIDKKETRVSKQFEDALSSAIEKRQIEGRDKEKIDAQQQTDIDQQIESDAKKITVRCPQCKSTFHTLKEEGIMKIKCPACGKEGVIK